MSIIRQITQLKGKLGTAKDASEKADILVELLQKIILVNDPECHLYLSELQELAKTLTPKAIAEECKAWVLINRAIIKRLKTDFKASLQESKQALSIFQSLADQPSVRGVMHRKGIADSYSNIGAIFYGQSNYPEAVTNYLAALDIRNEIWDRRGAAGIYNNLGAVYHKQGNYPTALKNHLEALAIFEDIRDEQNRASSHNNIGNVYWRMGDFMQALESYRAALKISKKIRDKQRTGASYINIGNAYEKQNNYPQAWKNYSQALQIFKELKEKYGTALSHHNMGSVHCSCREYPEALDNHRKALKIWEEIHDKWGIANSYCNIGLVLEKQRKYPEAIEALQKARLLAKESGIKNTLKEVFQGLSDCFKAMENYKEALDYYAQFHEVDTDILGAEKQEQLTNLRFNNQEEIKNNGSESKRLSVVDWLPISEAGGFFSEKIANILYCQGDGAITKFYLTGGAKKTSSTNLGEFEKILKPFLFCRISKEYLVNANHIKEFQHRGENGLVIMQDLNNTKLNVSKHYKADLFKSIGYKPSGRQAPE